MPSLSKELWSHELAMGWATCLFPIRFSLGLAKAYALFPDGETEVRGGRSPTRVTVVHMSVGTKLSDSKALGCHHRGTVPFGHNKPGSVMWNDC